MIEDDIRSQIISLLLKRDKVMYEDLESILGCDLESIERVCKNLRFDKLATDIDNVGIEGTKALRALPTSPTVPSVSPPLTPESEEADLIPEDHPKLDSSEITLFISYGREGRGLSLAERLEKDLSGDHNNGWHYNVYRDLNPHHGLQGGYDWEWELENQIESRSIFLSILTCHAVRRPDGYCLDEISYARSLQKKIIPLLVEKEEKGKVCRPPLCIHRLNFLDFQQWETEYETKFSELIRAIHAEQKYDGLSVKLLSDQESLKTVEFDFSDEIGRKSKGFVGRIWLTEQIDAWLLENKDQVFLLKGGPGTGKSTFLAYLSNHHPAVKAVHFCIRSREATRNPKRFIISLGSMIASQIPAYHKQLATLIQSESFLRKNPGDLLWDLIINPLGEVNADQDQVLVVIDAINESIEEGQSQIINLLSEQLRLERFPPWIRFLISTQPVSRVLTAFQGYSGCELIIDKPDMNEKDLSEYLIAVITSCSFNEARKKQGWEIDEKELERILLNSADGNFLYLNLILKDIISGYLKPTEQAFFPSGLSEYYQRSFERIFKNIGTYEKTRKILDLILTSREPLPLSLLSDLVDLSPKQIKELMEPIREFFEIEGSGDKITYRPFHSSFSDWLMGDKTDRDTSVIYQVDLLRGHQIISKYLEKRYNNGIIDHFILAHFPYHLYYARRYSKYSDLLLDAPFLKDKIQEKTLGILTLIEDYVWLERDIRLSQVIPGRKLRALRLILGALRLSSHVLLRDPSQLGTQMFGRLLGSEEPVIQKFLDHVTLEQMGPWLRPLHQALEAPGGALIRILAGHTGFVNTVAISDDGRRAVSGSWDNTLRVWDLKSDTSRELTGHIDKIMAVAISTDGQRAISGSYDHTLRVWDLESGTSRELSGHTHYVMAVAISADSRQAVSGSYDHTLRVWDLESGTSRELTGHIDKIMAVAISADGCQAVSGSYDHTLRVWDLESGTSRELIGHTDSVNAVAISADGRQAVSGSWDKTLRVWDLESGTSRELTGHTDSVNTVAISADGRRAVSGSYDHTLRVWDLESGTSRELTGHTDSVSTVAIFANGRWAVSGSLDKTLKIWSLVSGRELRTLAGHFGTVLTVVVTPDGRRAVSGSSDRTLRIWDLESGNSHELTGHTDSVNAVAISDDGRRAVSGSSDRSLRIWDLESGNSYELTGHTHRVSAVAISDDGRRAVSGSWDNTLRVWDLENGTSRELTGHTNSVNAVAISADGRQAVSGSWDKTLRIWDLENGTSRELTGHTHEVGTVAISDNGRWAVSGSSDNTLRIWDLATGTQMTAYSTDVGVTSCDMDERGKIIVGDTGGMIHILQFELGEKDTIQATSTKDS
jgi:WD40 repeat protein